LYVKGLPRFLYDLYKEKENRPEACGFWAVCKVVGTIHASFSQTRAQRQRVAAEKEEQGRRSIRRRLRHPMT